MSPDLFDAFNQGFQYLGGLLIWLAFLIPIVAMAVFGGFLLRWTNTVDSVSNDIALTVTFRIAAAVLWITCLLYIPTSFYGLDDEEVWMACVLAYAKCVTPAIAVLVVLEMGCFGWRGVANLQRRKSSRGDVQAMPLRQVVEGEV